MSNDINDNKIISHAYHWEVIDKFTDDDNLAIHAWTLDQDSKPHLLRFNSFPAICHVELPRYVNGRMFSWNASRANIVYGFLCKVLGEDAPMNSFFQMKAKIYYYRPGDNKYPMLMMVFRNLAAMRHCRALLKSPRNIKDIGTISLNMWEDDIDPVRKMLTTKKLLYSQWFSINVKKLDNCDKISKLEHEYIVSWKDIIPIDQDITDSWLTHPGILAFDIETYSDNHRAMPNRFNELHSSYMLSAIYQKTGMPETRKRYKILIGDCDDIKGTQIIRVKDERELCKAFCQVIEKTDPEIITGYNIFGYDYPYLNARLERFLDSSWDECASRLIGVNPHYVSSRNWASSGYGHNSTTHVHFPGRISIDLLPVIRRDYKLAKYDLNTVSKYFIGRGKHDVSAQEMFRIFEQSTLTSHLYQMCIKEWKPSKNEVDKSDEHIDYEPIYHDNIKPELIEFVKDHYTKAKQKMSIVGAYCIEDSELVIDVAEKIDLWLAATQLSNIAAVPIMSLFTRGQQVRGYSQIYNMAASMETVIDKRDKERIEYSGGFVYEPKPGLYDYMICLDFKSLYPNLMRAWNMCYTTLVPPEYDNVIPDEQCNVIEWDDEIEVDADEDSDSDDGETKPKPKGRKKKKTEMIKTHYRFRFIKKEIKEGILPQLVGRLIDGRNVVRKKQKTIDDKVMWKILEQRQLALKVCANSMYGMLGVQKKPDGGGEGVLPLIEAAMSITAKGRESIIFCNDYIVEKYNGLVVYNDTDSTMVTLPFVNNNKDALKWGKILEDEISALFPDPMYLEFEKAGRILCIKKKKYAIWMIDGREYIKNKQYNSDDTNSKEWIPNLKYGELCDPETDPEAIMTKGIILARRDNCQWQRDFYRRVLTNIITMEPMQDTLDIILGEIVKMSRAQIEWKDLTIIKGLGSNYKSDSYFMKVFSDELRRIGKPATPGDRLEYVIVKPIDAPTNAKGDTLLGYKMRLSDIYAEQLDTAEHEPIDTQYYIDKVITNCVEQLWMIGFKDQIKEVDDREFINDHLKILHELIGRGHQDVVEQTYNECKQDPVHTVEVLKYVHGLKTKTQEAYRKYISGRSVFNHRICKNIIKKMSKAIERKELDQLVQILGSDKLIQELYPGYNSNSGSIINVIG